jgi:hypothetical protein
MAEKKYVVVGQVATINVRNTMGVEQVMLYQGTTVPPGADPAKIKHLLDVGLIAELPNEDDPETNPAAQPDVVGEGPLPSGPRDEEPKVDLVVDDEGNPVGKTPDEVAAAEAEVQSTDAPADPEGVSLPPDGSAPAESANKATWVAYATAQGMDQAEATKASKRDLIEALKR